MKVNWKLALMCAAMVAFVACKDKNPADNPGKDDPKDEEAALVLDQNSVQLEVGASATITATVEATWTSSDAEVATVVPGNDGGKSALVTAVKEGNAVISATTKGGQTRTCIVVVKAKGGGQGGEEGNKIEAKRIWPIVLDGITAEANESLIAGDIRPDPENGNNLDIWASGETYTAGNGSGLNYFGNGEGYVSLIVAAPAGWSGGGFNIGKASSIQAMKDVKDAIVTNPDKMYLHIGMKATTAGNHEFYLFGSDATAFNIGSAAIEKGAVIGDFERDGAWHGFDIPMAQFANVIAEISINDAGQYIMSFLSGNATGSQLNLDAVYFYEKE